MEQLVSTTYHKPYIIANISIINVSNCHIMHLLLVTVIKENIPRLRGYDPISPGRDGAGTALWEGLSQVHDRPEL